MAVILYFFILSLKLYTFFSCQPLFNDPGCQPGVLMYCCIVYWCTVLYNGALLYVHAGSVMHMQCSVPVQVSNLHFQN